MCTKRLEDPGSLVLEPEYDYLTQMINLLKLIGQSTKVKIKRRVRKHIIQNHLHK